MSHIITIETKYKNINIIKEVCKRMNIKIEKGTYKFYYGDYVEGYKIYLQEYLEPIVITEDGKIIQDEMYEDYNGRLTKFKNTYCLLETERLLKKQQLRYKVFENDDEIKIEVIA